MAAKRQRLMQRRKTLGFSQEALASLLRVERSTVVRWESGETEPQPWLRPRMAEALQVSPDELSDLLARRGEQNADEQADHPVPEAAQMIGTGPALAQARQGALWHDLPAATTLPLAAGGTGDTSPVCQLPPTVADFTGREPQIRQLVELLAGDGDRLGVPIAVIAGLPGAGKTALAVQVAHRVRHAFPDGQLWVPLEGATGRPREPGEVLGELIRALGVPGPGVPASIPERASLYRSLLAGRRVLVLADDAAAADQIQPLLPGTGQSAVLVTSRSDLAGPPGSRLIQIDPLTPGESVQLLERIIGRKRVAAEPEAAAELASACGQLPLAVRIAGARLAARTSWQLSALASRMTRARRRLDELDTGSMSVRASVSQSYRALEDPAQRAFRRLALLDAAELTEWQVAALLGLGDAGQVVNQLADSSLLTAAGIDTVGQPRYRLHDLVRDYAAERLADEPVDEQDAALNRVIAGWLRLAAHAGAGLPHEPFFPPPGPVPGPAVITESLAKDITADPTAWFITERPALLGVIERCCANGCHEAGAQLASFLAGFWHLQGRFDDAERAWQMVTRAADHEGDPAAATRARLRLAAATCGQGRHAQASPLVDQCVAAFGEHGDKSGLATALYWHAVCEWNLGSYADAKHSALRAVRCAQDVGDRRGEALALRVLALATADAEPPDHVAAVAYADRALALARELGVPALEHETLHTVAHVCNLAGLHHEALRHSEVGRAIARQLGLQGELAGWFGIRGDAYQGLGRYREAAESLLVALPIFREQLTHRHHALCLLKLGYAYRGMGEVQVAARHLRESLDIFGQLRLSHYQARAREALLSCQKDQPAHQAAAASTTSY
jgi:tetratricopeptide (TPR) repeat protein/transcriptional regulator with XRE-family HTH domain